MQVDRIDLRRSMQKTGCSIGQPTRQSMGCITIITPETDHPIAEKVEQDRH